MTDSPRAVLYARISLDRRDGEGIERQLDAARNLAEAQGAKILDEISDNSQSAYSGTTRDGYTKLIRMIKAEEVDVIYVFAIDRLTRRVADTLELFELCENHHVRIIATRGTSIDPSDPSSKLVITMLGLVAEQESTDKAARVKASLMDRAHKGRPKAGGRRRFGYEIDGETINEDEAKAIVWAANRITRGKATLGDVVREWHARGLRSTRGNRFVSQTVRQILTNPYIAGQSTWMETDSEGRRSRGNRSIVAKGTWPAILNEEEWDSLQAALSNPSRKSNKAGTAPKSLVSGLMRCSCGSPMYRASRKRSDGQAIYYKCSARGSGGIPSVPEGTSHTSIGAEAEGFIETLVLRRMAQPDALEAVKHAIAANGSSASASEIAELRARITTIDDKLGELRDSYLNSRISIRDFETMSADLRKQLGALQARKDKLTDDVEAASLSDSLVAAESFAAWWSTASLPLRREVVEMLMTIDVAPGRRGAKSFDPNRIKITWRVFEEDDG